MKAVRVHDGDYIDYTPTSAVAAGDVIASGTGVGIATRDIPANTLGALSVSGVYDITKKAGDTPAFLANVYWDDTNKYATTTATSNTLLGKAVKAALAGDETVRVRLLQ